MSDNFKTLKPFVFWCQKILPAVYDDSLSYYELLCKVVDKLNEVINNVNAIPDFIRELVSDEKLKDILSELLDTLEEQIAHANEHTSKTATADRKYGDLVWLNGYLYRVIHDMIAGDQYVVDSNCVKVTIEELILNTYYPESETLKISGVITGESATGYCDYHVYDATNKVIKIIKNEEE